MSRIAVSKRKFAECDTCINREFDPFQCRTCVLASNWEPEEDEPESEANDMSYSDFLDMIRGNK